MAQAPLFGKGLGGSGRRLRLLQATDSSTDSEDPGEATAKAAAGLGASASSFSRGWISQPHTATGISFVAPMSQRPRSTTSGHPHQERDGAGGEEVRQTSQEGVTPPLWPWAVMDLRSRALAPGRWRPRRSAQLHLTTTHSKTKTRILSLLDP